jgi:uncharacterized coiled-coil DUF342 family protein
VNSIDELKIEMRQLQSRVETLNEGVVGLIKVLSKADERDKLVVEAMKALAEAGIKMEKKISALHVPMMMLGNSLGDIALQLERMQKEIKNGRSQVHQHGTAERQIDSGDDGDKGE